MKFSALPQSCRSVLVLLIGSGPLSRGEIIRALEQSDGFPTSTSDTGVRRLVTEGLVRRRPDNSYETTDAGRKAVQEHEENKIKEASELLARSNAVIVIPAECPPPEPDQPVTDRMMLQAELDAVLDASITRLQYPTIPAHSARVYRRLLAALDVLIQDALEPITKLVDGQS